MPILIIQLLSLFIYKCVYCSMDCNILKNNDVIIMLYVIDDRCIPHYEGVLYFKKKLVLGKQYLVYCTYCSISVYSLYQFVLKNQGLNLKTSIQTNTLVTTKNLDQAVNRRDFLILEYTLYAL